MSGQIKITLRRSAIRSSPKQRAVLRGLGLRRIDSSVLRPDDSAIRGMVRKVAHLVEVEEAASGGGSRDEVKTAGRRGDEVA